MATKPKMVGKLCVITLGMFAFGYALVPIYNAICEATGINVLSLARFFLFGARDVWFVVALPVFLEAALGWRFWEVGGFMGLWVIGYGIVQGAAPALRRTWGDGSPPGPAALQAGDNRRILRITGYLWAS